MSDAKIVDGQAGLESGIGTIMAALAGVNMVSGAGMMDFESCLSLEKLVMDHEIIGMARRLVRGMDCSEDPLATAIIQQVGHKGNFLATKHTIGWFQKELFMPSAVIDRDTRQAWEEKGTRDATQRAHERVEELIGTYEPRELPSEVIKELKDITLQAAKAAGLDKLPSLE
jgi:trimethylamine--corrinoid protein Co-methyltransferase